MKLKNAVYLVVTADRYELPIYVCETVQEVAYLLGIKKESVSHYINRTVKKYKIMRIKLC